MSGIAAALADLNGWMDDHAITTKVVVVGSAATVGLLARYRISQPHQFLVRTGLGIRNVKLSKQGIQWPFQTAQFVDVTPKQYNFSLGAMSSEKLQFLMPGVMTIGPRLDEPSLDKYAQLLSSGDPSRLIHGIIEGETRIIAASMKMDTLFQDRAGFKEAITKGVESELEAFGLQVYNANLMELEDTAGSEYFKYQRQKAREGANNEAKVDVAQAQMLGNVGAKEREMQQRQAQASMERQAQETEMQNQQALEKAKMELEQFRIQYHRQNETSRVEADQAVAMRNTELQAQLEELRYHQELKRGRAEQLVAAEIQASKAITQAEGEAEAQRRAANAELYVAQLKAEATQTTLEAEAAGVNKVIAALGGQPSAFLWYRMLEKDTLQQLAAENAKAVQNLQPKITVWNTGNGSGGTTNPLESIQKLFQFLPPILTTIAEQTGMQIPMVPSSDPSKDCASVK